MTHPFLFLKLLDEGKVLKLACFLETAGGGDKGKGCGAVGDAVGSESDPFLRGFNLRSTAGGVTSLEGENTEFGVRGDFSTVVAG